MKRQILVAAGLSVFAIASAGAQDLALSRCPAGNVGQPIPNADRAAQDACQQAYDLYQFLAPQLGLALVGGNATMGQGSTLGGLGHFSLGVRANVFQGSLPQVGSFTQSTTGAQRNLALPTQDQWAGLPTLDAAIGLYQGYPVGVTNVGGIDALVSASYIPTIDEPDLQVNPNSSVQLGYGARIGIMSESIIVPGVSFTWLQRELPTTTITGVSGNNSLRASNMKLKTTAWRIVASKTFLLFSFAGGLGKDSYDSSADILGSVSTGIAGIGIASATVPGTVQKLDRTNMFFDAALNLPLFKIVGEIGQATGGTVQTYNGFGGTRADRGLSYYSLGIRIGL